jgi:hypothetical protein
MVTSAEKQKFIPSLTNGRCYVAIAGVVVAHVGAAAAPNAPAVQRQLFRVAGGAERAGGRRRRVVGRPQAPLHHQPHPAAANAQQAAPHAAPRHAALGTPIW